MRISYAVAVLCFAGCTLLTLAASAAGPYYTTHFKQQVPLEQDPGHVAIQLPEAAWEQALRSGFSALGIAKDQLERHAVAGYVLVTVPHHPTEHRWGGADQHPGGADALR